MDRFATVLPTSAQDMSAKIPRIDTKKLLAEKSRSAIFNKKDVWNHKKTNYAETEFTF